MKIETVIEFQGYDDSYLSAAVDMTIESYSEYEELDECFSFSEGELLCDGKPVDYQKTYEGLNKNIITALNLELDTALEYRGMSSPRFYNFETDKLKVLASRSDILKVLAYARKEGFYEKISNSIDVFTTARDGYMPFYTKKELFMQKNRNHLYNCILTTVYYEIFEDIYDRYCVYEIDIEFCE